MGISLHGLRTVIYPAPDLAAAKAWWTAFLGTEPYFDEPFYVGYSVAGYELGLLASGVPQDRALTYWGVDDVAEAVLAAIDANCTEHSPPQDVDGGIVTATVRTPQLTVVGFIRNPHFTAL